MHTVNEALAICFAFATVATAVILTVRMILQHIRFQRLARLQSETVGKILDKLGSSPETLEWLRSGDMKRFFDLQQDKTTPYSRILNAVQMGLVIAGLGAGLITMGAQEGEREFHAIGMVLVCVSSGFLLSGAASYVLSRQWGLLEQRGHE